jgi:transposase-like protein
LRFTQTAALNDPFENLPSVADYRDTLRIQAREFAGVDASEEHLEANFQRLLDIIQSRYVYLCLSRINYSELMWAHYSASHTGFAIGFDTGNPFFYPENEVKGIGLRRVDYSRIRTNNVLERIMREIRRRTRVVGNFPDGKSAVMLVAARLRHIAGTRWGKRVYLDMERLREVTHTAAEIAIA